MEQILQKRNKLFNSLMISIILTFLICGLIYYIYFFQPVTYVHLIVEDSLGEYMTFMCYLASALLAAWLIMKKKEFRKPGYILLAACFFIMAMEEVSWMQRIIGVATPESLAEINHQDELNFHNIRYVKYTKITYSYLISFWALVLPFLRKKSKWINKMVQDLGIPVLPLHIIPIFALALFFFIAMPIPKYDEINELLFAWGFLWYVLSLFTSHRKGNKSSLRFRSLCTVSIALIISVSVILSAKWPYVRDLKWRFNQFASDVYFKNGLYTQAGKLYSYILERPHLHNETTAYNYAIYLLKSGEREKAKSILRNELSVKLQSLHENRENPRYNLMIAKIHDCLGNRKTGLNYYNKVISIYTDSLKKSSSSRERRKLHLLLGDICSLSKQFKKAAYHYRSAYKESSSTKEQEKTILHIQETVAVRLKDHRIKTQI